MVINSKFNNDFHSEKSTLENINLEVKVAFFFSLISFFPSHLDLLEREREREKNRAFGPHPFSFVYCERCDETLLIVACTAMVVSPGPR
jgi:hypothetical protein